MARYARIVNGKVESVVENPDAAWLAAYPGAVPCDDTVGGEHTYRNGTFFPPPVKHREFTVGQLIDTALQTGRTTVTDLGTLVGFDGTRAVRATDGNYVFRDADIGTAIDEVTLP